MSVRLFLQLNQKKVFTTRGQKLILLTNCVIYYQYRYFPETVRKLHPDVAELTEQKGPLGYLNPEEQQRLCASVILANPNKIALKNFDDIILHESIKLFLLPLAFETPDIYSGKELDTKNIICKIMYKGKVQETVSISPSYNEENSVFMGKIVDEKQILLSYVKDIPVIMNLENHVFDLQTDYVI